MSDKIINFLIDIYRNTIFIKLSYCFY